MRSTTPFSTRQALASGLRVLTRLLSGTLRDNVLFGSALDVAKYRRTMRACAMLPDVAALRAGDLAFIGENGLVLSGGQKQVARRSCCFCRLHMTHAPCSG